MTTAQGGFSPEAGAQQMPQGGAPMPQPPDGSVPPSGGYGEALPAPPSAGQAPPSGGEGSGQ